MFKKSISAIFMAYAMFTAAAAADSIFPVALTGVDGITKAGYMSEDGTAAVGFIYTQAGDFADCGLAAVENDRWQTAVINRSGQLIVPYTESPIRVDFSDDAFAYRYKDQSVYYDLEGNITGSYWGAEGFFNDGLLPRFDSSSGLYSYIDKSGSIAFPGEFVKAGEFSEGYALVKNTEGSYAAVDTSGNILCIFEDDVQPVHLKIFENGTVVLGRKGKQALYSIKTKQYVTDFVFTSISAFDYGTAMAKEGSLWGIINTQGKYLTKPSYHYLSYLGEGLYAARSSDGSASAVDANGNLVYRTPSYVGGFNELRYGLSWHGTDDGGLIFFKKNGGYFASIKNAENPKLLSENVVKVTQDGTTKYINLSNGGTLIEQPISFLLGNGITVNSVPYEKFLGYQKDGSEYGWDIILPEISGLVDEDVQKKINATIRNFFLKGPSVTAEYQSLEGSYGASLEGSVLVVWANCVSGKGEGAIVWNNSLAFDIYTGDTYQISDLLKPDYLDTVSSLLPPEHKFYMYCFPRISAAGVTYFYNEYESETRRAHTESHMLSFGQLWDVVDENSKCYKALQTEYVPPEKPVEPEPLFSDVPNTHWASEHIRKVYELGLMKGSNGLFRPDDPITTAEVCVTIARSQKLELPQNMMGMVDNSLWYSKEMGAVISAGLTKGIKLEPEKSMTREDAMQLFSNLLDKKGAELPSEQAALDALKGLSDLDRLSKTRRYAAAVCIREGLIQGNAKNQLRPQDAFTRAEFAKLLVTIMEASEANSASRTEN